MNKFTIALLLGVSLIASPVYAQSSDDDGPIGAAPGDGVDLDEDGVIDGAVGVGVGDDGVPGNGGGNNVFARNDAPSAPGRDRDTAENTVFGDRFGGGLSSDPVTARMVSDYVHGARTHRSPRRRPLGRGHRAAPGAGSRADELV